jgi:hypothetical protein
VHMLCEHVSKEGFASIFRVGKSVSEEPACESDSSLYPHYDVRGEVITEGSESVVLKNSN